MNNLLIKALLVVGFSIIATPGLTQTYPAGIQSALTTQSKYCTADGGQVTVEPNAVKRVDLTGNGTRDWVLDTKYMQCSNSASMYCGGTGGCDTYFAIGDKVISKLAKGWKVVQFYNSTTLLLGLHGSACGGIGTTPCVQALSWDSKIADFRSVLVQTKP